MFSYKRSVCGSNAEVFFFATRFVICILSWKCGDDKLKIAKSTPAHQLFTYSSLRLGSRLLRPLHVAVHPRLQDVEHLHSTQLNIRRSALQKYESPLFVHAA